MLRPFLATIALGLLATFPFLVQRSEDTKARMDRYAQSLGVECTHCHVDGKWADASKPPFGIAKNMSAMVSEVNAHLAQPDRVSCWTCHRGEAHPSRQPRPAFDAELAKWPAALAGAPEGRKVTMTVYNVALGVGCDHC